MRIKGLLTRRALYAMINCPGSRHDRFRPWKTAHTKDIQTYTHYIIYTYHIPAWPKMAAAGNIQQTVLDGLVICGVPTNIIWNQATQAEPIATDMFNNDFNTCLNKTFAQMMTTGKHTPLLLLPMARSELIHKLNITSEHLYNGAETKLGLVAIQLTPHFLSHVVPNSFAATILISNGVIVPLERLRRLNRNNLPRT